MLKSGEIDVLIRDFEMTLLRAGQLGLMEPAMKFYAGQSFLVRKSLGVQHTKDLNGATICLISGSTLEPNIANYNRANNINIKTLLFNRFDEAIAAVEAGRCDGYTDDGGSAAAARSNMKNPSDWVILPETIARQPMGPYTRQGDDRWTNIVAWTHYAMLEAEVLGITQANIDQVKATTKDPQTRQFLGLESNLGKGLGLENDFAYQVIKAVGNYGEVYEAYFGSHGLGLPRGLNNLYSNGGLMMPPSWYVSGTRLDQAAVSPSAGCAMAAAARGGGGRVASRLDGRREPGAPAHPLRLRLLGGEGEFRHPVPTD